MISSKPVLLVGLGNPGKKYSSTRHNAGFIFVEAVAQHFSVNFSAQERLHSEIARVHKPNMILAKPVTFMNLSGTALQALCAYYDIPHENIIIAHDDTDISFGKYRVQSDRGSAGHNGVGDIISKIGTKNFIRIRIGVRPDADTDSARLPARAFVLNNFTHDEMRFYKKTIIPAICDSLFSGIIPNKKVVLMTQ